MPWGRKEKEMQGVCVRACACVGRYLSMWAPGDRFHHNGLVFLLDLKAVVFFLGVNLAQRKSHNYWLAVCLT